MLQVLQTKLLHNAKHAYTCAIFVHTDFEILQKKRILFAKNAAKSFHVCKPMCCTLATTSFANLQNKS